MSLKISIKPFRSSNTASYGSVFIISWNFPMTSFEEKDPPKMVKTSGVTWSFFSWFISCSAGHKNGLALCKHLPVGYYSNKHMLADFYINNLCDTIYAQHWESLICPWSFVYTWDVLGLAGLFSCWSEQFLCWMN